ncbi:hypothetical protein, partial [Mesorhizobium captivum]|uniref:hypothetical protein n=1 Tax=Mesorhizobium captivum TaxID=3072319 RepID=UPI002A24CC5C
LGLITAQLGTFDAARGRPPIILGRSEREAGAQTLESMPLRLGSAAMQNDLFSAPLLPFS